MICLYPFHDSYFTIENEIIIAETLIIGKMPPFPRIGLESPVDHPFFQICYSSFVKLNEGVLLIPQKI